MGKLKLATVAAMTLTNGVGKDGGLPWRLKGEMAYFKDVTTYLPEAEKSQGARNAVIMGRNTWTSVPPKFRPLGGRLNIVISRTQTAQELGCDPNSEDVKVFASIEKALTHLSEPAAGRPSISRIFVLGGAQIWADVLSSEWSMAELDKLLVTRVLTPKYECDVHFPEFRTQEQYNADVEHAKEVLASRSVAGSPSVSEEGPANLLKQQTWTQASVESLRGYIGSACPAALRNSPDMITNEGETWYEYQLWERAT